MDIDIFELPGVLRRRWIYPAAASLGCGVLAVAFLLHQTPLYHATVELVIDPAGLSNPATSGTEAQNPLQGQLSTDSQIYIVGSTEVLSSVADKLDLQNDEWLAPPTSGGLLSRFLGVTRLTAEERRLEAVSMLREEITVLRAGQSLVFTVTMKHPSATKAADIANATAEAYLQLMDEGRTDTALRASMTLQAQADEVRQRLQKAQNEIEALKADAGLYSTKIKGLNSDQEIETLAQNIALAQTNAQSQQAIYEQVAKLSMAAVQSGAIPEALQSTELATLRTRYAQLLDNQAKLAVNLGDNHPQLKAARSQVESMRSSVEQELNRLRTSLKISAQRAQSDLDVLRQRYATLTAATANSGDARTRLAQLETNATALETLYQSYMTKAESLGGGQSFNADISRIISPALPPARASGAPKLLTLIAGLLFGSMLGTGLAVLHEQLSGAYRRRPQPVARKLAADQPIANDEPAAVPAAADIATPPARPARLGSAMAFFRNSPAIAADPAPRNASLGVTGVASMIENTFAGRSSAPVNVLFVPVSDTETGNDAAFDVARALATRLAPVYHSDGTQTPPPVQQRLIRRGSRVALAARSPLDSAVWGEGRLHFDRVAEDAVLSRAAATDQPFYLASAGGAGAQSVLPALLADADAIFAVAGPGMTDEALRKRLAPWGDKLLGTIAIEA